MIFHGAWRIDLDNDIAFNVHNGNSSKFKFQENKVFVRGVNIPASWMFEQLVSFLEKQSQLDGLRGEA